jgi:uncharacterized membrane protein YeaQ/YmgE (transglycosylase-associated protein family)
MTLALFVMWVLVGLLVGVLAGFAMKRGGYGRREDVILGLVGSVVGGRIFLALGVSPEAGVVAVALVAFIGAAILIVLQRTIWPVTA